MRKTKWGSDRAILSLAGMRCTARTTSGSVSFRMSLYLRPEGDGAAGSFSAQVAQEAKNNRGTERNQAGSHSDVPYWLRRVTTEAWCCFANTFQMRFPMRLRAIVPGCGLSACSGGKKDERIGRSSRVTSFASTNVDHSGPVARARTHQATRKDLALATSDLHFFDFSR